MNQYLKNVLCMSLLAMASTTGCQTQFSAQPNFPSEASLVAHAVDNGLVVELPIHYLEAYQNLRQAYGYCVSFTAEKEFVFTDNQLDDHLEMATLFARTKGGAYVSKTLVEGIGLNSTRLTLFVPKGYRFANTRLKLDAQRALGRDPLCNRPK